MTNGVAGRHAGPVLVAEREAGERQALGAALRVGGRPVIEVADAEACLVAAAAPGLAAVVLGLDHDPHRARPRLPLDRPDRPLNRAMPGDVSGRHRLSSTPAWSTFRCSRR